MVDERRICLTPCQPRPGQSHRVWESDGVASGPAGEPFSYLYKNSFCTVLLRGKRFWYLVILQSHLAAFVFLCQSCSFVWNFCFCFLLIKAKMLLFLKFLFEYVNFLSFFFFFNKKPCFKDWVSLHFILLPSLLETSQNSKLRARNAAGPWL